MRRKQIVPAAIFFLDFVNLSCTCVSSNTIVCVSAEPTSDVFCVGWGRNHEQVKNSV